MKKSLLLNITWITLVALTATTLYAQTATGTSIIDKMKAAVHTFTLATSLNPGQTGLDSAPVKGKKTGDILTAGEWNRVLELLSEGGGGSGWVDVPLAGTENFDDSCMYRLLTSWGIPTSYAGTNYWIYPITVSSQHIVINADSGSVGHIYSASKNVYRVDGVQALIVQKMQKLCGGGSSAGGSVQIIEGGIIKTSPKTISNWDLITLEWSWNSGGGDAAPTGGYIYKLNGQPRLSYVEASGISKDTVLTTTAQNVHNLTVKLSGDSVVIDPSSTNTLAYIVWKFSGGSATSSTSNGIGTPDYQSDWIDFGLAGNPIKKKFTHNLWTENYMIQMEGKWPGGDNNNCPSFIGADSSNSWLMNSSYWYYYDKTSTSISIANYTNSLGRCSRYIRIKLWKYSDPVIAPASTVTNL